VSCTGRRTETTDASGEAPVLSPSLQAIRERAYDIWERNHRPEGFDVAFWVMAERELKAELVAKSRSQHPTQVETGPKSLGVGPEGRSNLSNSAEHSLVQDR
jgi:hypothetical protein